MNNYKGDIKRKITEKKKNKEDHNFKLQIVNWVDGVLTKTISFFDSLEDAKKNYEDSEGEIKVYDFKDQPIHSEYREKKSKRGKGHVEHGRGHGYGHDHGHDDNDYS